MTTPQVATYALRLSIGTIRVGAGRKLPAHPFRPFTLPEIRHPRIRRAEISRIILGGGERYLSPERRLDAMIVNSPGLFS